MTEMKEQAKVRQIQGANVGAVGRITRIIEPRMYWADGTAGDGEIRVTFDGIRFPAVTYRYATVDQFIEII